MVSRLKVEQFGEFMGSPCAFGAPTAHVEVGAQISSYAG